MHQHKIENFQKTYPGVRFPAFQHLDMKRANAIRDSIAKSFDLPEGDGLTLVDRLRTISTETIDLQADAPVFSIERLLHDSQLTSSDKVYLNWYRYDDIDQMSLVDLDKHFLDIWYPGSDDLDVFDDSTTWILSIAHYGRVSLLRKT